MEPLVDTAPMPWSMEAEVALLVVQLRVEFCPASMVVGAALNVTVGGVTFTVTLAVAVTLPPLPVAVIVYVVVTVGVTVFDPFKKTLPIPWLIEAAVALLVVQLRVELWPCDRKLGEALKVITGSAGLTVIFAVAVVLVPAAFLIVIV